MNGDQAVRRTATQIFAVPLVVAAISLVGLLSALIGDDWWDAVSWLTLGIPITLYLIFYYWRRAAG
jgi:hypothetical protein